jgi:hypothetical protein
VFGEKLKIKEIANRVVKFYIDGFKSMKLGKRLWLIVAIKLFIMFAIIKLLFFPDILKEKFDNDKQRGDFILDQLTKGE